MRKFILVEIMASKENGHWQELELERILMKSLQQDKKEVIVLKTALTVLY